MRIAYLTQYNSDLVDALIKAEAERLDQAITGLGFSVEPGHLSYLSQYGIQYRTWRQGKIREEGEEAPRYENLGQLVTEAIDFFKEQSNLGATHIVWRKVPEFRYVPASKEGIVPGFLLRMRFHFLPHLAACYKTPDSVTIKK